MEGDHDLAIVEQCSKLGDMDCERRLNIPHSAVIILLDGLAGRCDAALMERREDRARADGVHTNALRRVVGGKRSRMLLRPVGR
jgi:hypothetical protein